MQLAQFRGHCSKTGSCYGATSHNNVAQRFRFGIMQFATIRLECDCVQVGQRCVNVATHKNWPGLSVSDRILPAPPNPDPIIMPAIRSPMRLQKVGISSVVLPLNLTFLSNRSQNPSAFQVSTSHRLRDVLSRLILLLSSRSENRLIIPASLLSNISLAQLQ